MHTATRLQGVSSSYIRDILRAASAPGMRSLAGGLPPEQGFPLPMVSDFFARITEQANLFQYGDSRGYAPLLEFLRSSFGLSCEQDLMITSGSQQGLDLIARAFLNAGDAVVVEAPSYLGALQVFQLAGAQLCPVRQTPGGPDLVQLEQLFRLDQPRLFYAVPDFHNPTGCCWNSETREAVAALCRRYDVALIEDAPYRALRFEGDALPMVSSLCPERALILRSTSKIAMPGLRIASLSAPSAWLRPLELVKQSTDLHSNVPLQAALLKVLSDSRFSDHLASLCRLYGERYRVLSNTLAEAGLLHDSVSGGMFLWLLLEGADADAVTKRCLSRQVAVVPGTAFYPSGEQAAPALRLNFTRLDEADLREAAETIIEEIRA
jgi:DNA-binding transcriptional MocR family regulator